MNNSEKPAALITGAFRRIGKALAFHLASQKIDLALHYRTPIEEQEDFLDELKGQGIRVTSYQADFEQAEGARPLMQRVLKDFPNITLIIHNASIFQPASFLDTTDEILEKNLRVHVTAPFQITQEFAHVHKNGLVLILGDTSINRCATDYFPYLLTKKSLASFAQMAAHSLAPGIRVNVIHPGLILPPEGKSQSYLEERAQTIPLKRHGQINELLQAVDFFIENPYITGESLHISGGAQL